MWSSIKHVVKPLNLNDALSLQQDPHAVLFSGGTYLVARKDPEVHTLVDINHLLTSAIKPQAEGLFLGAGVTLQEIADQGALGKAIRFSCPSKNIRNQRTLGGEIAEGRVNSDLMVYLYAAQAKLQINASDLFIEISDWDGNGIISMIHIPSGDTKIQRVAVLDSAPAYVIVAARETSEQISLAVGGTSERICFYAATGPPDEAGIRDFMDEVRTFFNDDQWGSRDYKLQLVSNLLHRLSGAL